MATGIELLLKSVGFDPEDMKRQATEVLAQAQTVLQSIDKRLANIERHLERLDNDGVVMPSQTAIEKWYSENPSRWDEMRKEMLDGTENDAIN